MELLIQYEAQVSLPDNRGCFPLHLAAWNGHDQICNELLSSHDSRWKVNEQNHDGETALLCAAQHGHMQAVSVLIKVNIETADMC